MFLTDLSLHWLAFACVCDMIGAKAGSEHAHLFKNTWYHHYRRVVHKHMLMMYRDSYNGPCFYQRYLMMETFFSDSIYKEPMKLTLMFWSVTGENVNLVIFSPNRVLRCCWLNCLLMYIINEAQNLLIFRSWNWRDLDLPSFFFIFLFQGLYERLLNSCGYSWQKTQQQPTIYGCYWCYQPQNYKILRSYVEYNNICLLMLFTARDSQFQQYE